MTATFVLSLDTEIAWGTYGNLEARANAFEVYPSLLRRLVRQLDIFEISATWAVVGGLLVPSEQLTDIPEPHYSFAQIPDSARRDGHPKEWFYAPDVIETIQMTRTPQEIGTHTLTHLLATDPGVSHEMFDAQLAAVVALHQQHGLPSPRSLVFPQNRVTYTDLLRQHGIIAYRGVASDWYARFPKAIKRPAHLIDRVMAITPPTYPLTAERIEDGLVNLPASQFLMSYDGVRARIPTESRVQQAEKGLQRAVNRNEMFHLWFHPFNLGSSDAMFDALTQILALVYDYRAAGALQVRTMGAVATDLCQAT